MELRVEAQPLNWALRSALWGCTLVRNLPGRYRLMGLADRLVQRSGAVFLRRRTVDGRWLWVCLSDPSHRRILFWGVMEPQWMAVTRALLRPGEVAVDVGANLGWYTTWFGRLVGRSGRVLAVEPMPDTARLLRANVQANGMADRVLVWESAAGASEGQTTLWVPADGNSGAVSQQLSDTVPSARSLVVPCTTVDTMVRDAGVEVVRLIKVDVEGAEGEVLRGARETIVRSRPAVIVEFNPRYRKGGLAEFLDEVDSERVYVPFRLRGARLAPVKASEHLTRYENLLLLPRDRTDVVWSRLQGLLASYC